MIQLRADCLLIKTMEGEAVPCSADAVTVELIGEAAGHLDPEMIQQAAEAVLHYYKHDLGRSMVSVGEFSETLERALRGLGLIVKTSAAATERGAVAKANLSELARAAGFELAFFQRLREELRQQLAACPQVICFTGLRECVKGLVQARRWNRQCQWLHERIVGYLRDAFQAEEQRPACTLIIR